MTSRFASNLVVMIAGVALVTFSLVLGSVVLGWVGFGLSCFVVVGVLGAFVARGRGIAQRILDVLIALAGGWMIVASRVFDGMPLKWLCFAAGALLALLAVIGLVVHEVAMEVALRPLAREPGDGRVPASTRERSPAP